MQEKEEENSDMEEPVPEPTDRKEHESRGQTGLESVQSEQAVELAGAAPEKEQGREVRPVPRGASWEGLFSPCVKACSFSSRDFCVMLFCS